MAIPLDIASLALTLSVLNTILIVLIMNKIKFRLDKNDVLTIITVLIEIISILKSNPQAEHDIKRLSGQIEKLLEKLTK